MHSPCPFCAFPQGRIVIANSLAMAIRDAYPVSLGRTLIVPKRHVATFFETTSEERISLFGLLSSRSRVHGWSVAVSPATPIGDSQRHRARRLRR
jgi:diadenosine tetraphosphate (Ap4A) HIT family hydrolase